MEGKRDAKVEWCFLCVCCELGGWECCHLFQTFLCVFLYKII